MSMPPTCDWYRDGDDEAEIWGTGCQNHFMINESSTPHDCGFVFCPFCGRKLTVEGSFPRPAREVKEGKP
jgi:hypothetical protein